jgi:MAF protein
MQNAFHYPPIILASSSKYRAQILDKLQLAYTQISPSIDESPLVNEAPVSLARRLSEQKSGKLAPVHQNSIIIASDQVAAAADNTLMGKPLTRDNAIQQLMQSSGKAITFYTGISVRYANTEETLQHQIAVETCRVHFKPLSLAQIEYYIDAEQPFDCAGSFKSEGFGISLFSKIEMEDPNTLVGLPAIRLCEFLFNINYDVLQRAK